MSQLTDCCACETPVVTNVPGVEGDAGADGADGADGLSSFTLLTADATFANDVDTVQVSVADNQMFVVGMTVFGADPSPGTDHGTFEVISLTGTTAVGLRYTSAPGDTAAPFTIGSGGKLAAAGATGALSAALPTALTDNSTGTASNTIAAGTGCFTLAIPHTFETGVGAGQVCTEYVLGFAFKILAWSFIADVPGVGAGASRVFNMEIGTTDVGTVVSTVTCTEASTSAKGEQTTGTAVSGANTGNAGSSFSIEVAAGGTQFTAGSGVFLVQIQNMDSANAIASLADHVNDLITALT